MKDKKTIQSGAGKRNSIVLGKTQLSIFKARDWHNYIYRFTGTHGNNYRETNPKRYIRAIASLSKIKTFI